MRLRINRKKDGRYYPEYRKFYIWRSFKETTIPKYVDGLAPFISDVVFNTKRECEDFLKSQIEYKF